MKVSINCISGVYKSISITLLLVVSFCVLAAQTPPADAAKSLPDSWGSFKASARIVPLKADNLKVANENFNATSGASRAYVAKDGLQIYVTVITTVSESSAFALLTNSRKSVATLDGTKI